MNQPGRRALKRMIDSLLDLGPRLDDAGECAVSILSAADTMTPADAADCVKYLLASAPETIVEYSDGAFTAKEVATAKEALQRVHEATGMIAPGLEDEMGGRLKSMFPMRFTFRSEGLSGTDHSRVSQSEETFSARQLTTQDLLKKPNFNESFRSGDQLQVTPIGGIGSSDRVSRISSATPLGGIRSQSRVIATPSQEDLAPPPEEIDRDEMLPEFFYYLFAAVSLAMTVYLFNYLMGFFTHNLIWQLTVPFIAAAIVLLRYAFKYNLTYLKIGLGLFLLSYGLWFGIAKRKETQQMAIIDVKTITTNSRLRKVASAVNKYYGEKGEMPRTIDDLLDPSLVWVYWIRGKDTPEDLVIDPFSPTNRSFILHSVRDSFILQSVGPTNNPRPLNITRLVKEQQPLEIQLDPYRYDRMNGTFSDGNLFVSGSR